MDIQEETRTRKPSTHSGNWRMQNNVQKLRWQKGWSLRQLEILSGVSKSTINALETGKNSNPNIEIALRLSYAFGMEVTEIFFAL